MGLGSASCTMAAQRPVPALSEQESAFEIAVAVHHTARAYHPTISFRTVQRLQAKHVDRLGTVHALDMTVNLQTNTVSTCIAARPL